MKPLRMGDSHKAVRVISGHDWSTTESGHLHTGCEVGVYRGATSALVLAACPSLTLFMVDPWGTYYADHPYRKSGDGCSRFSEEEQYENMVAAEKATEFAGKRAVIWQTESLLAAADVGRWIASSTFPKLSYVMHDADHRYEAVRDDTEAWFPHVERGGLFIWDDWNHPKERRNGAFGVKRAVDEFAEKHGLTINVSGTLAWTVKP